MKAIIATILIYLAFGMAIFEGILCLKEPYLAKKILKYSEKFY